MCIRDRARVCCRELNRALAPAESSPADASQAQLKAVREDRIQRGAARAASVVALDQRAERAGGRSALGHGDVRGRSAIAATLAAAEREVGEGVGAHREYELEPRRAVGARAAARRALAEPVERLEEELSLIHISEPTRPY